MEKELENRLRECLGNSQEEPDGAALMQTIRMARIEQQMSQSRQRIGFEKFLLLQIKYIGYRTWIMQAVLLAGAAGILLRLRGNGYFMAPKRLAMLMCGFAVLIFLTAVPGVCRTFRFKMHEVEAASRFSASWILLARILIAGIGDLVMIGGIAAMAGEWTACRTGNMFVYLVFSFMTVCCCGVGLLRRAGAERFPYYCAAMSFLLFGMIACLGKYCPAFFEQTFTKGWAGAGAAVLLVLIYQLRQLLRETEEKVYGW